jgi:AAA domain
MREELPIDVVESLPELLDRTATRPAETKPAFLGAKPKTGKQSAYWMSQWVNRSNIPSPDPLLGHVFMTGSRILLSAETGLGKTQIGMAWATAMALGKDFLHWKSHRLAKVLYIDGELPRYILQKRARLAYGFFDIDPSQPNLPPGPLLLSHEDNLDMPPIDTAEGQKWLDQKINSMGKLDFIVFDNMQALCSGNMKDEEGWRPLKGYARKLATLGIGQLWIHHTGLNTARAYGTSTREWGMQTVIVAERIGPQDGGPCFALNFTKATDREPTNASDFMPCIVELKDGKWTCAEVQEPDLERLNASEVIGLQALRAAMAEIKGSAPWKIWREKMIELGICKSEKKGSQGTACRRARDQLLGDGRVLAKDDETYCLPNSDPQELR